MNSTEHDNSGLMKGAHMSIRTTLSVAIMTLLGAGAGELLAADTKVEHNFPPIVWDFQGKPVPETRWSPWLPLGVQTGVRYKLGFRFSDGTISLRCPVGVTFTFDQSKAQSGSDFRIKVKATPIGSESDTFATAFGISLPNTLQVGLIGVTGLPIELPWFDLPLDFWDMVANIPKVGESIASAVSNIGVNTDTQDALPLGKSETYHDERDLISFDLTDKSPAELAPKIFDEIPENVRTNAVRAVKVANMVSDAEAIDILQDALETALSAIYDAPNLTLSADPYYVVEGVRLRLNVKCYIPDGKGSGYYTLYFDRSNQEQEIVFRDITPFVGDNDKIHIAVDKIAYEFRVKQGLTATVKLSVLDVDLDNVEKVVTYHTAELTPQDGFQIEVPLRKNTATLQSMRVNPGATSASVNWTSPNVPLMGYVSVYDSSRKFLKKVQENTYKNAHNVVVTGLQKGTTYIFGIECVSSSGQRFSGGELQTTTLTEIPTKVSDTTCNDLSMGSPQVTAGLDYIDFQWTTNVAASTEVLYSPSPDLSVNYVAAVKKRSGNVVQGWVTRDSGREFVTDHSMRITGLEPGVEYHYNVVSWTFEDPENEIDPQDRVGVVGSVTTLSIPRPSVKVKAQFRDAGVPDVPVIVTKAGDAGYRMAVITGVGGLTPLVTFDKASATYRFAVQGHPAYEDVTSGPLNVSAATEGEMPTVTLTLVSRPSPGGFVYDIQGNPIQDTTVKMLAPVQRQTTTDRLGHYTFDGWFDFVGTVQLEIGKQDFVTKKVLGAVGSVSYARMFSAPNCILPSAIATVNITAKTQSGAPVSGATILVKEGGTQKGSISTNAQGLATFACNFNDNNANEHNLTFELQPPTGSKIMAVATRLPVIGGSVQKLDLTAVEDTQGPQVSNFAVKQIGAHNICATFSLNDRTATSSLAYEDPKGRTGATDWSSGSGNQTDPTSFHQAILQGNSIDPGRYKIQVKAKDARGNITEGPFVEFTLFGESLWNLHATNVRQNSAVLRWNRFPAANEASFNKFGKYVLKVGNQTPIEITNADTTSYTVQNLSANTTYNASIHVVMAGSSGYLTVPGTASFQTRSSPPAVSNLTVQPSVSPMKEDIQVTATIADADTNVKKATLTLVDPKAKKDLASKTYNANNVAFEHSFKLDQPGDYTLVLAAADEAGETAAEQKITVLETEKPKISLAKVPSTSNVGDTITATVRITNIENLKGDLECRVNWGDGTDETVPVKGKDKLALGAETESKSDTVELSHAYKNDGAFTIAVSADLAIAKTRITSDPVSKNITIKSVAATANLTKQGRDNTFTFHIKAIQGSYPIASWTLDFGDGVKESGQGSVDKDVTHVYPRKGEYAVKFDVTDSKNAVVSKTTSLKIRNDAALDSAAQNPSGGTVLKPAGDADAAPGDGDGASRGGGDQEARGDLALVELQLPDSIRAGRSASVAVAVKNDSNVALDGVGVTLYVGGKKIEAQHVTLKAGETATLTFKYTPGKPATYTFMAKITRPSGFADSNTRNDSITRKATAQ